MGGGGARNLRRRILRRGESCRPSRISIEWLPCHGCCLPAKKAATDWIAATMVGVIAFADIGLVLADLAMTSEKTKRRTIRILALEFRWVQSYPTPTWIVADRCDCWKTW